MDVVLRLLCEAMGLSPVPRVRDRRRSAAKPRAGQLCVYNQYGNQQIQPHYLSWAEKQSLAWPPGLIAIAAGVVVHHTLGTFSTNGPSARVPKA